MLFAALVSLRLTGGWRAPDAVVVGIGIWLAMFESRIDPVIAGLAIGLVTSAYLPARSDLERATELARSFGEQPTPELAYSAQRSLISMISPNERLQYRMHPWTSFCVVPLFALAHAQGAFWEMHDLLFAHQDALTPLDQRRYANDLNLDIEKFSEDLHQRRHAPRVRADVASADVSGVSGTPTFVVNGRRHHDAYDVAALTAAVRSTRASMPISEADQRRL